MRKILYIIVLISVFILVITCTACNKDDTVNMGIPNTEPIETERVQTSIINTSENAYKNTDDIQPTESAIVENTGSPINTQSPSQTLSQDTKPTSSNTVSRTATAKPSTEKPLTKPPTATPKPSTAKPTVVPTKTVVRATSEDAVKIADRVIYYINEYRSLDTVKLPGLTQVAEYRSKQLITNFAHDTDDMRAAATFYKYGQYIDPPLYGIEGEPYYTSNSREAIASHSRSGTIDAIAQHFAKMVKDSEGHWNYVGADKYPHIAVGISYNKGLWYCCILVTNISEYG